MSKHHHHDECCYPTSYGYAGYSAGGYGAGAGGHSFVRWIYALLILIVIVLQFGRKSRTCDNVVNPCDDGVVATTGSCDGLLGNHFCDNQLIDNSVLFIIIVFLLIICSGCWGGGYGGYGAGGYGY